MLISGFTRKTLVTYEDIHATEHQKAIPNLCRCGERITLPHFLTCAHWKEQRQLVNVEAARHEEEKKHEGNLEYLLKKIEKTPLCEEVELRRKAKLLRRIVAAIAKHIHPTP